MKIARKSKRNKGYTVFRRNLGKVGIAVLFAVSALAAAVMAAEGAMMWRHNLAANGRWLSSKTALAKTAMGSYYFEHGRQALAQGCLNLGAWHGFQEVVYREPVQVKRFAFDFYLESGAHVSLVLKSPEGELWGVLLSACPYLETAEFNATAAGRFTAKTPLTGQPLFQDAWNRIELTRSDNKVLLRLNGRMTPLQLQFDQPVHAGFRGSHRKVLIDNVELYDEEGKQIVVENFSHRHKYPLFLAGALASVLALTGLMAVVLRLRKTPLREIALSAGALQLGLAAAGLLFYAHAYVTQAKYPALFFSDTAKPIQENDIGEINERIANLMLPKPPETLRILVLGTSQTNGAGASQESDVFVAQLEKLLQQACPDRRIECINAGVRAGTLPVLLTAYSTKWIEVEPDWVIVNLGNNDASTEHFPQFLVRLARLNKLRGINTLFSLEPVSVERNLMRLYTHDLMCQVAAGFDIPVANVFQALKEQYRTGFLWWDFVHPTSHGHRLIAEALFKALTKEGATKINENGKI